MKNIFLFYFLLIISAGYAQNIGVNATGATPNASSILDLNTGNTFTSPNGKGLLPPNVALTGITDAVTVTSPATSLLVYNTATAGTGTAAVVPGYYYWDGTKWVTFGVNDWHTTGNVGTTAGTNFLGTTDAQDLVIKTANAERVRVLAANGSVGIGTNNPLAIVHAESNSNGDARMLLRNTNNTGNGARELLELGQGAGGKYGYLAHYNDGYNNPLYPNITPNSTGLFSGGSLLLGANTFTDNIKLGITTMNSTYMTIQGTNGNVGINTTTPANKLEITQGTAGNSGLRFTNLPNAAVLRTDANGDVIPATASTATNNGVFWGLLGNAGTTAGTNFLGTTDNQNLIFKRNNVQSGLISTINTSFGNNALNPVSTGGWNTAIGAEAMRSNTTGNENTATGFYALRDNTTGSRNTANGFSTLAANTTGSFNSVLGAYALQANTTGVENSAFGYYTLNNNSTGGRNVAVGSSALGSNITGNYNISIGAYSLLSNNANQNNAIGGRCMYFNTTGVNNVALGFESLFENTTGSNNTAIGHHAGGTSTSTINVTGNNNTFLGANASVLADNLTNATAIGYNAKVGQSNALILGGTGADAVNVGIGTTTPNYKLDVVGSDATVYDPNDVGMATYQNSIIGSFHNTALTNTSGAFIRLANRSTIVSVVDLGVIGNLSIPGSSNFVIRTRKANGFMHEQVRIDCNSGYVGIGTVNPLAKLDVLDGDVRASRSSSLTESYLRQDGGVELFRDNTSGSNQFNGYVDFKNNNTYDYNARLTYDHTIGATGAFAILTSTPGAVASTDYRMVVDNATGNVGIGTTTPSSRLEVNSSTATEVTVTGNGSFYHNGAIVFKANNGSNTRATGMYMFDNGGQNEWFAGRAYNQGVGSSDCFVVNRLSTSTYDGAAAGIQDGTGTPNGTTNFFIIKNSGNTGIGTTTPVYKLDVVGDINSSTTVRAGGVALTSDARLKKNVTNYTNALNTIMQLRPVEYQKKESISSSNYNKQEIGFIAQELQKILPQLVQEGKDADKLLSVDYISLIPVLTKAIQELNEEINNLKTENETLKVSASKLSELETKINSLLNNPVLINSGISKK